MSLYKMTTSQRECSRTACRFIIKFFMAEKCKEREIYKKMRDVYEEAFLVEKYL